MNKKLFAVLGILALLLALLPVAVTAAPAPSDLIAVDMDPYYKSLTGEAAFAKIHADTVSAAPELAEAAAAPAASAGVGDIELFYADGWQEFTLRALADNAEIWVANDLSYCPGDPRPPHVVTQEQVDYLLAEFNDTIYPSNTTYFGYTNDRDGTGGLFAASGYDWYVTDNPQRMMILVYNIVDEGYCDPTYPFYVAGYFWATMNDTYANRNIIHIDSHDWANRIGPDGSRPYLYEQVFTHEFEHAIHYDYDADEPSWVDEGMADLAPYLAGYGHSRGHIEYYLTYHRTPLTVWGGGLEDYGESYLFQLYLLENFGGPGFIKALVNEQLNGIEGIENQLAAFGYGTSFNDIYRDWTLANYLDEAGLIGNSGAKLGYDNLDIPSVDTNWVDIPWSIKNVYGSDNAGNLPIPRYWGGYKSGTVQYPVGDLLPYTPMYLTYKGIQPVLNSYFRGANTTGVAAYSGEYQLWGGRGDLMFNTAKLAAPITLSSNAFLNFWTYYEIEELWDFGFVQISTDNGSTWTSLANANTTSAHDSQAHPDVIANLPGFTGHSGGWVEQNFNLSAYAGQQVLIRFLYVTDWGTVETGFYVDDITITDDNGTQLFDDLEGGGGNWVLGGWEYTTGLAENDWELTYINPIYQKGKFSNFQILDDNVYVAIRPSDGKLYQFDETVFSTQNLANDVVTIVVSNHLPEDTSFPASYTHLVEKASAKK